MFMILHPNNFELEKTTIWSFSERGSWATHAGNYRGNWSPYVARNLILRYSNSNDWVLDQFLGSGTSLIEAKLLGRNAIGVDINMQAINLASSNIEFKCLKEPQIIIKLADAKKLNFIESESIDLICTHPPYSNIIKYSDGIENDLSLLPYDEFLRAMYDVAIESYRVLKRQKICSIMIGDIRRNGNVVPLGMEVMNIFLKIGFKSKEIIIKQQHNCRSTPYWRNKNNKFLMLAHEYIFIFEK